MKMPKKLKAAWVKALRSGKYKQGKHRMYRPEDKSFCCLGVLEHVAMNGRVEIVGEDAEDAEDEEEAEVEAQAA